ncbi:S41 family peptidase [Rhodospirillum rubrum]|nr:S41 family peptidase [Rhodospirillum rubrum]QXG79941.1 PDZ domain-containing protein [Rhodospirillum rubrum]
MGAVLTEAPRRTSTRRVVLTLLAGLTGCAHPAPLASTALPQATAVSHSGKIPPTAVWTVPSAFDKGLRGETEDLFSYGYGAIADRYIDEVNLRELGVEGLSGLTSLDPAITVAPVGAMLDVYRNGTVVGRFPLAGARDSAGWGVLTANVVMLARDLSPSLNASDPEEIYQAIFTSALGGLDPFSRYASRDDAEVNRGQRNGFGGIGVMYDVGGRGATITQVMPGTPAADARLRLGDVIVAVNGQSTRGATRHDLREWLRGPTSSEVTLTLVSADTPTERTLTLTRALIIMPTVDLHLDEGVGFITVSSFNQGTTTRVAEAIGEARRQLGADLRGLVIDLRGNPGGLLDQAVTMSDLFLDTGPIVSTRGRNPDARQFYASSGGDIAQNLPIVALIDGDSASAAEIVAAALQDNGRAVVIGTSSFGKGTVQTLIQLPNGGELTLTWSRFHSPSGYVLHGLGVLPVACTSGIAEASREDGAPADKVLTTMRRDQSEIAAHVALWRQTDMRDASRRLALRDACPAEHHPRALIDETVARKLIADQGLYGRALRLTAPAQSASGL